MVQVLLKRDILYSFLAHSINRKKNINGMEIIDIRNILYIVIFVFGHDRRMASIPIPTNTQQFHLKLSIIVVMCMAMAIKLKSHNVSKKFMAILHLRLFR